MRPVSRCGRDIRENFDLIDAYLRQITFAHFAQDYRTRDAVERCLVRLGVASSQIRAASSSATANGSTPGLAELSQMAPEPDAVVPPETLWEIVSARIPEIRPIAEGEIARLPVGED
jgi:uncharacterized protein with HEPN domain